MCEYKDAYMHIQLDLDLSIASVGSKMAPYSTLPYKRTSLINVQGLEFLEN